MDQERIKKLAGIMSEDVETDEELLNKVAMWIYHESDRPVEEINYLLSKSGAVGEYMDVVSEHKETGIKEDWKDEEFSAKGREADEKSMQAAQDRYDASQNELERNPGDMILNHLNDIDKFVDMLEEEPQEDIDHKINLIRIAVEKIRTNIDDLNNQGF
jgi:hypothetical protein